jgi:hypothetical protein
LALAGAASAQVCGEVDADVILSLDGNTVAAAATETDLASQDAADAWWAANVYNAALVTVCDSATPVCQYDIASTTYSCIAECAAPIDMDALVAGPALTEGTVCYPSTPTSDTITVAETSSSTSDETAGAACTAYITELPEEGCTADDLPSGDDATDDDYSAYIALCVYDASADDCADDTSCATVYDLTDGSTSYSCQACAVKFTVADMKDEAAGAAKGLEMATTNVLDDGSFYTCIEASTTLMYSAAAALAAISMTA